MSCPLRSVALGIGILLHATLLHATLFHATVASASDLRTYPTRLSLTPGAAIGAINVRNNDTTKALLQLEAMRWYQENGEDKYEVTRDLLVNPVIFEVAPGAEQVVRIGLQIGVADVERSYRLFLQEVTPQDAAPKAGITTLLRIGIPIFVPPTRPATNVIWDVTPGADGKHVSIGIANSGSTHIQVTNYSLARGADQLVGKGSAFIYALSGQSRRWEAAIDAPVRVGETLQLSTETDAGSLKADVVVGAPIARAARK